MAKRKQNRQSDYSMETMLAEFENYEPSNNRLQPWPMPKSAAERDKLQVLQGQLDNIANMLRPLLVLVEKAQWEVQQMREGK